MTRQFLAAIICFTSQLAFAGHSSHIITTTDLRLVDFDCKVEDEVTDLGSCVVRFQQNGYGVIMDFKASFELVSPFTGLAKNSPALSGLSVVFSDETNEIFAIRDGEGHLLSQKLAYE